MWSITFFLLYCIYSITIATVVKTFEKAYQSDCFLGESWRATWRMAQNKYYYYYIPLLLWTDYSLVFSHCFHFQWEHFSYEKKSIVESSNASFFLLNWFTSLKNTLIQNLVMDELNPVIIKKTQDTLGKHVKKPNLSDKLLRKPPFKFLHDVINVVNYAC